MNGSVGRLQRWTVAVVCGVLVVLLGVVAAGTAWADPVNGALTTELQDLRCDFGEGFEDIQAVAVDGADVGHVLDSTQIGVVHVLTVKTFVDGLLVREGGFTHPGMGLHLVPCAWTLADFVDEQGRHIQVLAEGLVLVTPSGSD
jgi:hypothetical protein